MVIADCGGTDGDGFAGGNVLMGIVVLVVMHLILIMILMVV